jgi:hypothetical protein
MDALAGLAPRGETYARLPVADAFNWADVATAFEPGEWYLVAFRSILRPGADIDRLRAYDDWAHAEASDAPGFVHYFKGPLGGDGSCLSFCLWNSRDEARAASARPAHRDAVTLTSEVYEAYALEFIRLRKTHAGGRLEFAAYGLVRRRAAPPRRRRTALELSSVRS